ncbi:hypothetical protein L596_013200 [Steinernema carpocapsae]|uniref:Uncharacterized protein n=1 Tax=Steinernema carpocapsae TaxID=34508 RepID=A0A4U5NZY5_STECR|nr:hypothetical protein L596_013200 [Steinernema carpocapsae]
MRLVLASSASLRVHIPYSRSLIVALVISSCFKLFIISVSSALLEFPEMTNKGLIPFKFTDKQSDPVEIGDFEWNTDRRGCIFVTTESDRCDAITCFPKKKSPTILYNCLSMGTIALLYETNHFSYLMWNGSCGNNSPWVCVHHKKEKVWEALTAIGIPKPEEANGEVSVEIVDSFVTDLSDPKNTLIECERED